MATNESLTIQKQQHKLQIAQVVLSSLLLILLIKSNK